jgi:nicotinate-nucleotide adenylyltransferase
MSRIGIYGGTFDPPHNGHLAIADQAAKQLRLDRIYFVPAYIPPHKRGFTTTSGRHRSAMVKLAIGNRRSFKISNIELNRRGISYTIDTIKSFQTRFSHADLVLIIGADNFQQFHSWKSPEKIVQMCSLAVYKRIGFHQRLKAKNPSFTILKGHFLKVSSTEIRNRLLKGTSIKTLVPRSVGNYIKQNVLYSKALSKNKTKQTHENHSSR